MLSNGGQLYSKLFEYKREYDRWIEKYGKIELDPEEDMHKYAGKVMRVYKSERY
jgi:hypothetical protein